MAEPTPQSSVAAVLSDDGKVEGTSFLHRKGDDPELDYDDAVEL